MVLRWICCLALSFVFSPAVAKDLKFAKKTLRINGKVLSVEIADTPEKQELGLMFRTSLKESDGMLFIFPDEQPRAFWMKNTFVDLAIGYFSEKRVLIDIQEMKAVSSMMENRPPSYPSRASAKYALEVRKGWFDRNKIKLGAKFTLD
jgi:hypothetical protein